MDKQLQSAIEEQESEGQAGPVSTPSTPWRARNIYSYVKIKKKTLDKAILALLVLIAFLVLWMALTTKGLPVSFETYGGTPIESQRYMYGEKIVRPANPKREGAVFLDWYPNYAFIAPWDFENDVVSGEMTLHAKWQDSGAGEQSQRGN